MAAQSAEWASEREREREGEKLKSSATYVVVAREGSREWDILRTNCVGI